MLVCICVIVVPVRLVTVLFSYVTAVFVLLVTTLSSICFTAALCCALMCADVRGYDVICAAVLCCVMCAAMRCYAVLCCAVMCAAMRCSVVCHW